MEHGWDGATTPDVVGTFTQGTPVTLAVPASAAQRYKIRVEHVETTGEARCSYCGTVYKLKAGEKVGHGH